MYQTSAEQLPERFLCKSCKPTAWSKQGTNTRNRQFPHHYFCNNLRSSPIILAHQFCLVIVTTSARTHTGADNEFHHMGEAFREISGLCLVVCGPRRLVEVGLTKPLHFQRHDIMVGSNPPPPWARKERSSATDANEPHAATRSHCVNPNVSACKIDHNSRLPLPLWLLRCRSASHLRRRRHPSLQRRRRPHRRPSLSAETWAALGAECWGVGC